MSLLPTLRPLIVAGAAQAPHTIDIFLDYVCPYSGKMVRKIDTILKPLLGPGGKYEGKAKVIYRIQVQPWHAVSTLTSEAGLAVLKASPEYFWPFSLALYKHQEEYYDIPSQDLTIRQIKEKLVNLAATVIPPGDEAKVKALLEFKGAPADNAGNAVTNDLKYNIKYARQNSVHVSPTVLFDGLVQHDVSSGWEQKDWEPFLEKMIVI